MAPEDWKILPFGEFATLKRGFDLPIAVRQSGSVPVVAAAGVIDHHHKAKVKGPGVTTGRSGTIGRVTFVEEDFWPLNTTLFVEDFHGNLPAFVALFLEFFALERFATGTGVRTLNRNRVHQERVVIPSLGEQRRIVEIVRCVDRAIEAARQVKSQNLRVDLGVRTRMLCQGIGSHRLRESRLGPIPESWTVRSLGTLCRLSNGHSFRIDDWAPEGLPIIRIQNLNGSRAFKFFAGMPKARWIVEPGDLLFAWAGSKNASFGPTLWQGPRGVLNQHIFRVEPVMGIDKEWLFEILTRITRELAICSRGFKETLQHLRKSDLTAHLVALPPALEQRLIVRHCEHLRQLSDVQQRSLDRLLRVRRGLLQDLMSGRVRTRPRVPTEIWLDQID